MDWTITKKNIVPASELLAACLDAIEWLMSHPGLTWIDLDEQRPDLVSRMFDNLSVCEPEGGK